MNNDILQIVEELLNKKLEPIQENINNLMLEIRSIKEGLKSLSKQEHSSMFGFDTNHSIMNAFPEGPSATYSGRDVEVIWSRARQVIKDELTEVSYNTWIKPINPIKLEKNTIFLEASCSFTQNVLHGRYLDLIKSAIAAVTLQEFDIKIEVAE